MDNSEEIKIERIGLPINEEHCEFYRKDFELTCGKRLGGRCEASCNYDCKYKLFEELLIKEKNIREFIRREINLRKGIIKEKIDESDACLYNHGWIDALEKINEFYTEFAPHLKKA